MRHHKRILEHRPTPDCIPTISFQALDEVKRDFDAYCSLVYSSGLTPASQKTYIDGAQCFVRWLEGRFRPGQRVRKLA
jgi:hypothetical protein